MVTEKTWADVTKKAKELEHIIQKCELLVTASTSMQAAAVPGLYPQLSLMTTMLTIYQNHSRVQKVEAVRNQVKVTKTQQQ